MFMCLFIDLEKEQGSFADVPFCRKPEVSGEVVTSGGGGVEWGKVGREGVKVRGVKYGLEVGFDSGGSISDLPRRWSLPTQLSHTSRR